MAVTVAQPQRRAPVQQREAKEKEDVFDIILKGLKVAELTTGAAVNVENLMTNKMKTEQQMKLAGLQQQSLEREQRQASMLEQGILPQSELLKAQATGEYKITEAERAAPGAIGVGMEDVIDEKTGEKLGTRAQRYVNISKKETPITPYQRESLQVEAGKIAATMGKVADEKTEKGALTLSNKFDNSKVADMLPPLERIDKLFVELGLPDGLDTDASKLNVDIPGFGVTGAASPLLLSDKGKALRQDVNSVVNVMLNMRSGGAINADEAKRLADEIKGANTDQDLLRGLSNLKTTLSSKMNNARASVPAQSVALYSERNPGVFESPLLTGKRDYKIEQQGQPEMRRTAGAMNILDNLINNRATAVGMK